MNLRLIFVFLFFVFSLSLGATQYRLLSLAKQINEADVFVVGIVTSVEPMEREGRIWSKVNLALKNSLNYQHAQIGFIMPGGSLNGKSMKIESVDVPLVGDQRNYLLKKYKEFYVLNNLGLGEYLKKEISGNDVFSSKVYPEVASLKNLSLEDFKKASGGKKWEIVNFTKQLKKSASGTRIIVDANSRENLAIKILPEKVTKRASWQWGLLSMAFLAFSVFLYLAFRSKNGGTK